MYYGRIRNEGLKWNHKRVKRIYDQLGLNIRRKHKRRLPNREKVALTVPDSINKKWSMDFMSDALIDGRKFRTFNLIDDFNREVLAVEADTSLPAQRVVRVLERVIWEYGKPASIRVDNGPEFISHTLATFCEEKGIHLHFIMPGKPMQNGYIERLNRTFREDVLDAYLFKNLKEVRERAEQWREDYNNHHPHGSLNGYSPIGYRNALENNYQTNHLTSTIINPQKSNNNLS